MSEELETGMFHQPAIANKKYRSHSCSFLSNVEWECCHQAEENLLISDLFFSLSSVSSSIITHHLTILINFDHTKS